MCPGILKIKYLLMNSPVFFRTLINLTLNQTCYSSPFQILSVTSPERKIKDSHPQLYQYSYSCQSQGFDTKRIYQVFFFFFFQIPNLTTRIPISNSSSRKLFIHSLFHSQWPGKYLTLRPPFQTLFANSNPNLLFGNQFFWIKFKKRQTALASNFFFPKD